MRKVVVTGLGFATCLGLDAVAVSERLRTLRHGFVLYDQAFGGESPVGVAAPVPGFRTEGMDPEDWEYPDGLEFRIDQLRCLSPNVLYAVHAVEAALVDAGLEVSELRNGRTGIYSASAGSAMMSYYHMERMRRLGASRAMPMGMISSIAGTLNFNLVARYGIRGASTGFVSACASSGHALGFAFDEITLGRQDRMIVVGAEDFTPETVLPFRAMRVLSSSSDPDRASRPFDRNRDGFVATGGAVVMVLEAEETAARRGARPRAQLHGWGQATDGHHVAIPEPEGDGLRRAIENALSATGTRPGEVDYINAHATSTTIGDVAECRAIKAVFGCRDDLPISSTKALTGHALSLAGAMEAAFCVLAIDEGFIPGAAHLEDLDPEAEGLFLPREGLDRAPRRVLSNSSGFGGANVALLLGPHGG